MMRLIFGILIALGLIAIGYFALAYDLKGYMLGAFGILLGAFLYYSSAASTASEAIEYTTPRDGATDMIFDTVRTLMLVFIFGFISSKLVDISLAGRFNVYMFEIWMLFLLFTYISFWELKHTVHHVLKAMFMLEAPKKFI